MPVLALVANYAIARATEPSTWSAIAGLLVAAHVNVSPGVWGYATGIASAAAGLAGVLMKEAGS